jgi:DNA-binding MarR family transcriptional regulator
VGIDAVAGVGRSAGARPSKTMQSLACSRSGSFCRPPPESEKGPRPRAGTPAREVLKQHPVTNAQFFGLKRAFHATLRLTRPLLAKLGLTAARFDLLYALPHGWNRFCRDMRQSDLRALLGVSRPTVSRMLASLEEPGLIRRERDVFDRRQIRVTLTQRGRALIRKAVRHFMDSGWAELALDSALDRRLPGERWCDDGFCLTETEELDGLLRRIRTAFGDFATLSYPWHPDD